MKVVALEETKRMVPHTTSNSPWFGWKMPRKPSDSPETGAGSGVRCEPLFDGDSVLVSPGEERDARG
ncbi:hypothetical protein ACFX1S_001495 [Malus domestica]